MAEFVQTNSTPISKEWEGCLSRGHVKQWRTWCV